MRKSQSTSSRVVFVNFSEQCSFIVSWYTSFVAIDALYVYNFTEHKLSDPFNICIVRVKSI